MQPNPMCSNAATLQGRFSGGCDDSSISRCSQRELAALLPGGEVQLRRPQLAAVSVSCATCSFGTYVVKPYFGRSLLDRNLASLSGADVQRVLNELTTRGLVPRTVRCAHATIRRALYVAQRIGKLSRYVGT